MRAQSLTSLACIFFLTIITPISAATPSNTSRSADAGIHKIQHIVIIMQENHSFDNYFGTYPGANGIPAGVCIPDPETGNCVKPYENTSGKNIGGPHGHDAAVMDIDHGKMDGFIAAAEQLRKREQDPTVVVSYHTGTELANYWTYANDFVLQDNLFAAASSWSLPEHLYMVSAWSAACSLGDPLSCRSDLKLYGENRVKGQKFGNNVIVDCRSATNENCETELESPPFDISANIAAQLHSQVGQNCEPWNGKPQCTDALNTFRQGKLTPDQWQLIKVDIDAAQRMDYPWTDVTYLLHKNGVSWKYYLFEGEEPDCEDDDEAVCGSKKQYANTPGIWNPLASFDTVNINDQVKNIVPVQDFYTDAANGTLPSVSWVIPDSLVSEHEPSKIKDGQAYVTGLVNALMQGPEWPSTAIFLSWDDWGGFYDHVVPPRADKNGYGLRVPGLVISPYAKKGYIDHQLLSHDAYLKFIEDVFLQSQRLDPNTDGRPDNRPDVREDLEGAGDLTGDFDFSQAPRPPVLLPGGVRYDGARQ